ncbi:hypothetical protein PVT67_18700 [Gallaecimonas kandeliae]|uniref:hypothetical protein n=1 Tax=Gallaecimonas kandeliae TaxID=3029055 RepID=UPI0026487403|nr:hypothetical protein [Gallaecimonas kandeliae]WKE65664.1 hypothetical protein PVT67_18700 [Gallaecimonas kandeliae]
MSPVPLWWLLPLLAQADVPAFPPLEQFQGIIDRPLFNPSRRPEVGEDSGDAQALKQQWALTGVVLQGDVPLALLSSQTDDRRLTLSPGMPLDQNWQVEEILPDRVKFRSGTKVAELELGATKPKGNKAVPRPTNRRDNAKKPEKKQE